MTLNEAIKNREKCLNYLIGCGAMATPENVEAVRMSLEALREKQERENPAPLTAEELQKMGGQPVWIVWPDGRIKSQWWIVNSGSWYTMELDDDFSNGTYGERWIAYRQQPPKGGAPVDP